MDTSRRLFTADRAERRALREVIQSVFALELLCPSNEFWLVSPWVSDIPVVDGRTGQFRDLAREWGRRWYRLGEVLLEMARRGCSVTVVTRPDQIRPPFLSEDVGAGLRIVPRDNIHAKGIVATGYCLVGSMNFTQAGIDRWDELVTLDCSDAAVAELRMRFQQAFDT